MSDVDAILAAAAEAIAEERTGRALADARVVELERENDRLRQALASVVAAFTEPDAPDGPGAVEHRGPLP